MEEINSSFCNFVYAADLCLSVPANEYRGWEKLSPGVKASSRFWKISAQKLLPRLAAHWISRLMRICQVKNPDRFLLHQGHTSANFWQMWKQWISFGFVSRQFLFQVLMLPSPPNTAREGFLIKTFCIVQSNTWLWAEDIGDQLAVKQKVASELCKQNPSLMWFPCWPSWAQASQTSPVLPGTD